MESAPLQMQAPLVSMEERRWAAGIHIGVLVLALMTSWAAGVAGALGAGAALMMRPLNSEFVAQHAREALNFNLSMFIYLMIGILVSIFTFGVGLLITIPLGIVLGLVWLICSVMAAIAANDGLAYRYPFTLRLF